MSFRQRLAGWLAPRPESRSLSADISGMYARPTLAGTSISERSALSIAAVWNAVNIYANTIGALELYVAEKDARGGRRPAMDHPAFDLINRRPNRVSTSMRLRQAWIGHALTFGNGYLEIEWDARGRTPIALHLMDPRHTEPFVDPEGCVWYRQTNGGESLPADSVLHLAMLGWDGLRGYGVIKVGVETFGLAEAQRVYQAGLYGNSAQAGGHLEVAGRMDTKQQSELRDNWNRIHQGPASAGNLGILQGGAKWVQTNFSPQDAQMILGAEFSVAEIARFFNLPQHKLGLLEHATFSNIEYQNI
jgi:HK97 family phage portal protein